VLNSQDVAQFMGEQRIARAAIGHYNLSGIAKSGQWPKGRSTACSAWHSGLKIVICQKHFDARTGAQSGYCDLFGCR